MKRLDGAILFLTFDHYDEFLWTDDKGQTTPIKSMVGLMEFGDGTRNWVKVGFPKDDDFRPANLTKGTHYAVPVIASINRKRMEVRWTFRMDMAPFEAPSISPSQAAA